MTHGHAREPMVFDRAFLTDMPDVTEVVLVRHAEQYVPDPRRGPVGDMIDPPLTERGREQARLVGERLSVEKIDVVYSSGLQRARQTAEEIARHHRLPVAIMDDLREIEVFREIPADRSAIDFMGRPLLLGIRERMLRERSWDVYPYSESSAEFRRRTVNAIEAIIAEHEGLRIAVACHGGVINAYLGHVIGTASDMFFRPAHTSLSIVAAGGGVRAVHSLNDTHHLVTPEGVFISH